MKAKSVLTFEQVGSAFRVEETLLWEFADFGLFSTVTGPRGPGIASGSLEHLERILSLHRDLGLNKEGIDAVLRLGELVAALRQRIEVLEAARDQGTR